MVHTDDNLIEARLRQLEARTSITGNLQPPSADAFWPEMPMAPSSSVPSSAGTNRWLGPILGIVVGSVVTQLITALGSTEMHPPVSQVAVAAAPTSEAAPATVDPTTQALARLIAAKPATVTPEAPPVRSIDTAEIVKLQQTRKLTVGRKDPFAVIVPDAPPLIVPATTLPPIQVIVPEPPAGPVATAAPKPASQIRFNGSFAADGAYTALVEETAQGQTTMRRWHQGDTVLGGYRVVEIGLRTLKLRWGGETVLLSVGTSQDLEHRSGTSGLSAIAPEPVDMTARARPALWQPSPAASSRTPLSTPLATPLPPIATPEAPAAPQAVAVETPVSPLAETGADDATSKLAPHTTVK